MSRKSTAKRSARKDGTKPAKPYPKFPLTPHASGHWCKKINGTIRYFGRWGRRVNGKMERVAGDGWKAALELYNAQRDDLFAGRVPRAKRDGLTVGELCDRFLVAKAKQRDAGELTGRTWEEYKSTTDRLVSTFGKGRLVEDLAADDFEGLRAQMAKLWGPVRLGNGIQRVRTVFKYGWEAGLMKTPVRFGPQFRKPSAATMRKARNAAGEKFLEAAELRKLIDAAPAPLKAMILLGANCGLGNHDLAMLPETALDLDRGWLNYPRPKTGVQRRCPLWPETVSAIREALAVRPEPKPEAEGLVFVTSRHRPWLNSAGIANPISVAIRDVMGTVGINRPGVGPYALRHTFRTVADAAKDQPAANYIMGHAPRAGDMSAVYRERIDDSRLLAVTAHVHGWLWPKPAKPKGKGKGKGKGKAAPKPKKAAGESDSPRLRIVG